MKNATVEVKPVTVDFRKEKYKLIFEAVVYESSKFEGKLSPTIMSMLAELMEYRKKDNRLFIKDVQNNIVAPL